MIYTRKTFAVFLIGGIMLLLGFLAYTDALNGIIEYLGIKKKTEEIQTLCLVFGSLSLLYGVYATIIPRSPGNIDYFMGAFPGAMLILFIAMMVKWGAAPGVEIAGKILGDDYNLKFGDKYIHKLFTLNHITIGIIAGFVVANFTKVPSWAEHGVRISRMVLKAGVILLGSLYSFTTIYQLGSVAIVIIAAFTLGTVALVLWAGMRYRIPHSMSGVLASGMGVCGVSASIAAAPVVQAKSTEIAYTIATILLWGLVCMLVFPSIGHYLELNPTQFGAWAGTGILNSAQVVAAATAYDPINLEAAKTANAFNITRVLFLPLIVLGLAIWYVQQDKSDKTSEMNMGEILIDRFPIFVLGFVLMFALSSQGIFAPKNHYKGKYFSNRVVQAKLLQAGDANILQKQLDERKVKLERRRQAMLRLIDRKKIMSESDEIQLKGLVKRGKISPKAKTILKESLKAVRHTSNKIKRIRQFIDWLFTFGLVGLGMQITIASIRQAGGAPMFIGGVVGTLKAVGSLFVIMYAVDVTIT